ncbi:protein FAM3A-like [Mixophyes fleayi]|uniref:protein FAM3A-like n=1 Tax=Mixophyes fleayi TaxID=3061075 RepID=UPI003F4D84CD
MKRIDVIWIMVIRLMLLSFVLISGQSITYKCGNVNDCPNNYMTFKVTGGQTNKVGPKICVDNATLVSDALRNTGIGLSLALVNVNSAEVLGSCYFNTNFGDKHLPKLLSSLGNGTLVFVATFDEASRNMDNQTRALFASLGSQYSNSLGSRDGWVFAGGQGIENFTPFEKYIKKPANSGWPAQITIEGCIEMKK